MISRVTTRGAAALALLLALSGCTLLFPAPEDTVRASMQGQLDELKERLGDAARDAPSSEALAEAVLRDHALGVVVIRADDDREDFEDRQITSENITVYALEQDADAVTIVAVVASSTTGGTIEPQPLVGYGCVELTTGTGKLVQVESRSVDCPEDVVETSFTGARLIEVS